MAENASLANKAAQAIIASSKSPETWNRQPGQPGQPIVAVMADRTTWPVVGMLAALKAGAAYVGLDLEREGGERLQVFSGDVSRPDLGLDPQRHTALESDKVNQAERLFVAV